MNMKIKKRNVFRLIQFSLVLIFFIWQWSTYQSRGLPKNTFEDNGQVTIEISKDKITFTANNSNRINEIIFFQGGLTDPKAYAPLCRQIAENGFTCHLTQNELENPSVELYKNCQNVQPKEGELHNWWTFPRSKHGISIRVRKSEFDERAFSFRNISSERF